MFSCNKKNFTPEMCWNEFYLKISERKKENHKQFVIEDRTQYARNNKAFILSQDHLGLILDVLPKSDRVSFANENEALIKNGYCLAAILESFAESEQLSYALSQIHKIDNIKQFKVVEQCLSPDAQARLTLEFNKVVSVFFAEKKNQFNQEVDKPIQSTVFTHKKF